MIDDTLALPREAYIGCPIYKNRFTDPAALHKEETKRLSAADRKLFDNVERILWQYALKPENTNLPAYADEEKSYGEIEVIEVALKGPGPASRLAEIILRAIPYAMLLFIRDGTRLCLYMGKLRKSRAEKDAVTVAEIISLPWMEEDDSRWEALAYTRQRAGHLYDLYRSWYDQVSRARLAAEGIQAEQLTGEEARALKKELDRINLAMGQLRIRMKKASRFSEKAALNEELYALKQRKKALLRASEERG